MTGQPRQALPGIDATTPTEVPAAGWKQILVRAFKEGGKDNVSILSGGIAYAVFTSLVPTLSAVILVYGLVVSPDQAARQVQSLAGNLPANARGVLQTLVSTITSSNSGALGIGLVISVLLALFSASGAVNSMITAVNVAYDEENTRNFVKKRLIAFGLTVGGIVFFVVVLGIVAGLPVVLKAVNLGDLAGVLTQVASVALLAVLFVMALAVLYRVAPDRDSPRFAWTSPGALAAAVVWVIASAALGVYVRIGNFGSAFGPLAGVIVLLFWLYLTAYVILLGAEINSEAELQTARDTTRGDPLPLGDRKARRPTGFPEGASLSRAEAAAAEGVDEAALVDGDTGVTAGVSAGSGAGSRGGQDETGADHRARAVAASTHHRRRGATMSSDREAGQRTGRRSLDGRAGQDAVRAGVDLVRSEIQLAMIELKAKGKKLGLGGGLLGGAGTIALYGINAAIATVIIVLALVLPLWLAALIVTVVLFGLAGILALLGRRELVQGTPPIPREAIASTKKDVAALKEAAHR